MRGLFAALGQTSNAQGQAMNDVTYTTTSRALKKAARWQIIVTVLISGVSLLVAGVGAAVSAMAGGASVIVGGLAGLAVLAVAQRLNGATPTFVLMSLLKAEAIKVLVIVTLLLVTFVYYRGLVPLFLILGLAGSVLASGAGLRTMNNKDNENNE